VNPAIELQNTKYCYSGYNRQQPAANGFPLRGEKKKRRKILVFSWLFIRFLMHGDMEIGPQFPE